MMPPMWRSWFALAWLASCDANARFEDAASVPPDASSGAFTCATSLPAIRPIARDESISEWPMCAPAAVRPYPTTGCVLDLRAHRAGSPATCGAEVARGTTEHDLPTHPIRIDAATQLPLVIELPASPGLDPGCPTLCDNQVESATVFAIHFALDPPPGPPFYFWHLRVEPPWRVVSGNEGDPTVCDNGRPSIPEFHRSCVFTHVDNFAVVTDDPSAPPARAIIEADPTTTNDVAGCCLYSPAT